VEANQQIDYYAIFSEIDSTKENSCIYNLRIREQYPNIKCTWKPATDVRDVYHTLIISKYDEIIWSNAFAGGGGSSNNIFGFNTYLFGEIHYTDGTTREIVIIYDGELTLNNMSILYSPNIKSE